MSPERMDPDGSWQGKDARDPNWADSPDEYVPPFDEEDEEMGELGEMAGVAPLAYGDEDEAMAPFAGSVGMEEKGESLASKFEALPYLRQRLAPFLIPLGIGGIIFLATLPTISGGRVDRLISVALVFLALAVLQGMTLYYADLKVLLWALGIVAGFCLFLLAGCFVVFGPAATMVLLVLLVIFVGIAAKKYLRVTPDGTVEIVNSFGKYSRTLLPGLNVRLPWEARPKILSTREKQWECPEQHIPVSLNQEAHLKVTMSYQLTPNFAYLAVVQGDNWEESMRNRFVEVIREVVAGLSADDFMESPQGSRFQALSGSRHDQGEQASTWEQIESLLMYYLRNEAARWGVQLNRVQLRDAHFTLAATAQPAMAQGQRAQGPAALHDDVTVKMGGTQFSSPRDAVAPAAATAAIKPKNAKEEALINLYTQVQEGSIKSPKTIHELADAFQLIAQDPQENQQVSFDAAHAAQQLRLKAHWYETHAPRQSYADEVPIERGQRRGFNTDRAQVERPPRRPGDSSRGGG